MSAEELRINTDDLDRELEHISSLANIGSTSDADSAQLNDLFVVVLEIVERAQALVSNLEQRPPLTERDKEMIGGGR